MEIAEGRLVGVRARSSQEKTMNASTGSSPEAVTAPTDLCISSWAQRKMVLRLVGAYALQNEERQS